MGQPLSKGVTDWVQALLVQSTTPCGTDSLPPPMGFPQYQRLPRELKEMIWEHSFEPRHVRIWGQWIPNYAPQSKHATTSRYAIRSSARNPVALSVDTRSRAVALRHYEAIQFRCQLTFNDQQALVNAHDLRPGTLWWYLRDSSHLSLVSESLAYFNTKIGDTVDINLVNHNAYHVSPSPNSHALDFSSPDHFQILRMKGCRYDFDRAVTSVLWPEARLRWHILGTLTNHCANSEDCEAILQLRCAQARHGSGDFKVVSETGAIRCRLCGRRLAWGFQL